MKLVIDIPEKVYNEYMDLATGCIPTYKACDIAWVLRKATLLPKGHGRLIDVDELINKASVKLHMFGDIGYIRLDEFARLLDEEAPTIIEADEENKE